MDQPLKPPTKAQELRAFLLLSVVMAPVLAVAVVSGYGFLVWMVQLVAGDMEGKATRSGRVTVDDASPQPGLCVEAAEQRDGGMADGLEILQ